MTETDAWFYRQLARSRNIVIDGVPGAMGHSAEIGCTFLLTPGEGLRALLAHCLEVDGSQAQS